MPLLILGNRFIKDLEKHSALATYAPLEGGFEGRYLRRLRANGYNSLSLSARGLGDLKAYLTTIHGVRPPHLGKKTIGNEAAVGYTYYIPPILSTQLSQLSPNSKGLVLWLLEGIILSSQEIAYLKQLAIQTPQLKIVVEMGGERYFRWSEL